MAAALKNIEIIEREALVANADQLGQYFYNRLVGVLQEKHPTIGAVSGGLGLLASLALVKNRRTGERYPGGSDGPFLSRLAALVRENGLALRVGHTVTLAPPLIATKELLDDIVLRLDDSLFQAEREFPPEL
jgi:adenosylmethionine-8-amino-7-oxononanoate aminotransferase